MDNIVQQKNKGIDEANVNYSDTTSYNFYPIWLRTDEYEKFFCIQTRPEFKVWIKDVELTYDEFKHIVNNIK